MPAWVSLTGVMIALAGFSLSTQAAGDRGSDGAADGAGDGSKAAMTVPPGSNAPEIVQLRPAMRIPALLPPAGPGSQRPRPPVPLTDEQRADIVAELFETAAGDTISLTPADPLDAAAGYLAFQDPHRVDPVHGAHFDTAGRGAAILSLNVEAGDGYLVDFAVNGWDAGVYSITADGADLEVTDDGSLAHVLVGIRTTRAGRINVRLSRAGSGFYLHAVAVTPAVVMPDEPGQSDSAPVGPAED